MNPPPRRSALPVRIRLPKEIRYEGRQYTRRGSLLCFTDLKTHGVFCLLSAQATSDAIARRARQLRRGLLSAAATAAA